MPNSTPVSDSQTALAAQYNNLRQDVFNETTGHPHDGTSSGGRKVDHEDLVDGAITGTTYQHSEIDDHIDAGSGVHDLHSAALVTGSLNTQLVFDAGYFSPGAATGSVSYTTPFATVTSIQLTCYHASQTVVGEMQAIVTSSAVDGFSWRVSTSPQPQPTTVYWLAIGTK